MLAYYDARGTFDSDYREQARAGADTAWYPVAPGIASYVADKVSDAHEAGLGVVLNLTQLIWDDATMGLRAAALEDYGDLDAALSARDLWSAVRAFYVFDEPLNHAVAAQTDKRGVLQTIRTVNRVLADLHPGKRRIGVFSYPELLRGHAWEIPEDVVADGLGCTEVGFSCYSEKDGQGYGDSPESYRNLFDELRRRFPNTLKALIPDAVMFEQDELTLVDKLRRIDWILDLAREPDVLDVFPYCWSVSTNGQQGLKEVPELLAHYASRSADVTGRST